MLPPGKQESDYIEKVLALIPDWSIFMQIRNLNFQNLIELSSAVLIGQKCAS